LLRQDVVLNLNNRPETVSGPVCFSFGFLKASCILQVVKSFIL